MTEQRENIKRVNEKIAPYVIEFMRWRRTMSPQFTADELRDYIAGIDNRIAPDSPGRILRQLRQRGKVNYRVVNRAQSLYEALP